MTSALIDQWEEGGVPPPRLCSPSAERTADQGGGQFWLIGRARNKTTEDFSVPGRRSPTEEGRKHRLGGRILTNRPGRTKRQQQQQPLPENRDAALFWRWMDGQQGVKVEREICKSTNVKDIEGCMFWLCCNCGSLSHLSSSPPQPAIPNAYKLPASTSHLPFCMSWSCTAFVHDMYSGILLRTTNGFCRPYQPAGDTHTPPT